MDKLKISGHLVIKARDKDGNILWEKEGDNLITSNGYLSLLQGLSGTANKNILKVQAGTNSTSTSTSDSAITNPLDLTIANFAISSSKLVISFNFGELEGNGQSWSEFGLICADGTLFSRKVVPTFTKIQDLSIEGIWTINI